MSCIVEWVQTVPLSDQTHFSRHRNKYQQHTENIFINQLKKSHQVTINEDSDFLADGIYTF